MSSNAPVSTKDLDRYHQSFSKDMLSGYRWSQRRKFLEVREQAAIIDAEQANMAIRIVQSLRPVRRGGDREKRTSA